MGHVISYQTPTSVWGDGETVLPERNFRGIQGGSRHKTICSRKHRRDLAKWTGLSGYDDHSPSPALGSNQVRTVMWKATEQPESTEDAYKAKAKQCISNFQVTSGAAEIKPMVNDPSTHQQHPLELVILPEERIAERLIPLLPTERSSSARDSGHGRKIRCFRTAAVHPVYFAVRHHLCPRPAIPSI